MPKKLKNRHRGRIVSNNSVTNLYSATNSTSSRPTSANKPSTLSDEALFFVDKSASRDAKRKRSFPDPVDADGLPLRAVDVARQRVLGIDAALVSNAQSVAAKKPHTTPRPVQSSTEHLVKRIRKSSAGADPVERAHAGFEAHVAHRRKTDLPSAGTYDLWNDSKAPSTVVNSISKKKRVPIVAKGESLKAGALKTIPAVLPPLDAESVNPKMDDYLDFAAATVASYERDERDRVSKNQVMSANRGRKHAGVAEVLQQESEDEEADNNKINKSRANNDNDDNAADDMAGVIDDDANDAEVSAELSDETKAALLEAHTIKPPKPYHKVSVHDRLHREKSGDRVAELEAAQAEEMAKLDTIIAELESERERGAAHTARARKVSAERAGQTAGVGRNKFSEPDPHVVLPKRIVQNQGRLVRVAATPYGARDMMASLQRRGKAEVGSKAVRHNNRTTYNVK